MNTLFQTFSQTLHLDFKRERFLFLSLLGVLSIFCAILIFFSPLKTLALFVAVLLVFAAVIKPHYVVFILAVYTPFEPFLLKFVPDEIYVFARYGLEGLIYLLALVVLWRVLIGQGSLKKTAIGLPFVLFLIVLVVSASINFISLESSVLGIRQIVRFIILYLVIVNLRLDTKFIKKLVYIMLALVVIQSLIGISQYLSDGRLDSFLLPSAKKQYGTLLLTSGTDQFWAEGQRVFATMGRYDQLGTFLAFFGLLAVGLLYQNKKFQKQNKLLIVLTLGIICLLLTYSRASWFGFALGLLLIGAFIKRDKKVILGFVFLILVFFFYLIGSGLLVHRLTDQPETSLAERFYEAFSYERWRGEYYGLGRLYFIVQTPLKVVSTYPLFGVGPGSYGGGAAASLHNTEVYEELGLPFGIFGNSGHIDNNWMSLWGETGTLGLIIYVWMLLAIYIFVYKVFKLSNSKFTKGLSLGFLGALLAVTFQAFLGTYFEVRTLGLYLWLIAGLITVLAYQEGLTKKIWKQS
ncbi:MAG: O-antigen ligase family protein [Patescibacteria group bacterium]